MVRRGRDDCVTNPRRGARALEAVSRAHDTSVGSRRGLIRPRGAGDTRSATAPRRAPQQPDHPRVRGFAGGTLARGASRPPAHTPAAFGVVRPSGPARSGSGPSAAARNPARAAAYRGRSAFVPGAGTTGDAAPPDAGDRARTAGAQPRAWPSGSCLAPRSARWRPRAHRHRRSAGLLGRRAAAVPRRPTSCGPEWRTRPKRR